jgi:hypothetical protein
MIFSENRYTLFRIMRVVRKKEAAELDARRPFSFSVDGGAGRGGHTDANCNEIIENRWS